MTFEEFRADVEARGDWFRGRLPETEESLREYERRLGVALPRSMKWLLRTHGYWHATAVDALNEAVARTLELRENAGLPRRYLVLNDWGDAGAVVLDSGTVDAEGEAAVFWIGYHDLEALCTGQGLSRTASRSRT